jgi:PAS domain S-box-containing protein
MPDLNQLDPRTITLVFVLLNLISATVVGILWWQHRFRFQGLGFWFANALLQGAGMLLIALRGIIPDGISILGSNFCIVAGLALFFDGCHRYFSLKPLSRGWYAIPLAAIGLIIPFTFVQDDVNWRIIINAAAMVAIMAPLAWWLLRRAPDSLRRYSRPFSWLAMAYLVVFLFRIAVNFMAPHQPDFFNGPQMDNIALLGMELLIFALAFVQLSSTTLRLSLVLESEEKRYRDLFSANRDGVVVVDLRGRCLEANQAFCDMLGFSLEEIRQLPDFASITPERWRAWEQDEIRDRLLHKQGFTGLYQKEYIRKDGSIIPVEMQSFAARDEAGRLRYYWGIIRDITARVKAERELRESEQRYRTIYATMDEGMCLHQIEFDPSGQAVDYRILEVNPAYESLVGVSRDKAVGQLASVLYASTPPPFLEVYARVASTGQPESFESAYVPLAKSFRISVSSPSPGRFTTVFTDITERLKVAAELRGSEERFRTLVNLAGDAIIAWDEGFHIVGWNRAAERIFGYSMEEAVRLHPGFMLPPRLREASINAGEKLRRTGVQERRGQPFESVGLRKDGSEFPMEATISYTGAGADIRVIAVVRDISERLKLDEERRRADRLESLGTLAGGIAHDFNNILTSIMGNVSVARFTEDSRERDNILMEAEKASQRAAALAKQLLTFARGGSPIKELLDAGALLRETANFALSGSNCAPVYEISPDLRAVSADRGQVAQVIQNLVINASEAMPAGGLITLRAGNLELSAADPSGLPPGMYARIEVEDAGPGIPVEIAGRIFNPYFTTKASGRGLGLATSRSIIQRHGGTLRFRPGDGKGTIFTLLLPALGFTPPPAAAMRSIKTTSAHAAGKRVLVMDDEPQVRDTAVAILRHFGCRVTAVSDGEQALELYRQAAENGTPFAAVILDLTIPGGMGGLEALRRLKQLDPVVKAIVSSGYSESDAITACREAGFIGAIPKPYRLEDLAAILDQVLKK